MQLVEFYDEVEKHPELEGVGIDTRGGKDIALVKHKPTQLVTSLPIDAVLALDWPSILPVLVCEREPEVLQHMSRVVGYFSRTANWNKSKLGELKDRHKGNYALQEG
jgi:hypothetical protein